MWRLSAIGPVVVAIASTASAQTVIFVDDDAPRGGDGTSWASAYDDLQDALDVGEAGDEIWVAAGTYRPSSRTERDDPRTATFQLQSGVALFGGFAATETRRKDRYIVANMTILGGDLHGDDVLTGRPIERDVA